MPPLSRWLVRVALAYLVAGFTLGALMLAAKALEHPAVMVRLLMPHVEFLLVGWTMQLTMGVAFWILPRFASGASRGTVGYAWLAFVLVNAGVLAVGFGALVGNDNVARLVGRGAECGAAVAFAAHAWQRIRAASA